MTGAVSNSLRVLQITNGSCCRRHVIRMLARRGCSTRVHTLQKAHMFHRLVDSDVLSWQVTVARHVHVPLLQQHAWDRQGTFEPPTRRPLHSPASQCLKPCVLFSISNIVLQVEWDSFVDASVLPEVPVAGSGIADILKEDLEPEKTVKVAPLQFHFHSASEHTINGQFVRTPGDLSAGARATGSVSSSNRVALAAKVTALLFLS